jgi:hypothetical protein
MRHIVKLTLSSLLSAGFALAACSSAEEDVVSSRAYKGHENDLDMNYFVNAHRNTLGTRLDDCQTCHTGGTFTYDSGGQTRTVFKNACDYCHLIHHPDPDGFNEPQPTAYAQTLNPYGVDYKAAGRNQAAVRAIAAQDSDGDGFSNQVEIDDLKYPGDPGSKPGQQVAPMRTFGLADLKALPVHDQFILANSHKQQFDDYAAYRGVKVVDLLQAAGVDVQDPAFQGVTVIAPDGYLKDIPAAAVLTAYPAGVFHAGLDTATLGTECGFVKYPDQLPAGVADGQTIPGEPWLQLAYAREGLPMDPSNLDPTSGKINGEGPLRLVVPQSDPGSPDRGSQYSPTTCNDGWDYDASKNHNAGDMVRGVIAIRVNPLQAGVEDFDYRNGGWAFIDSQSLLVYGFGVNPD